GPRTAKALEAAFGMRTVGDLLRHYPRRYYTRGELTDLSSLREGDHVTVLARVDHVGTHQMPSKGYNAGRAEVVITDDRAKLILVYPASAKASSWMIARAVKTVLDPLDAGEDPLPAELRERHGLVGRAEAIRAIHRPLDQADLKRARERLKWDEAFLLQAALA